MATGFTQQDRELLLLLVSKLPDKGFLTGTDNPRGSLEMDAATGNFGGSVGAVEGDVRGAVFGEMGSLSRQAKKDVEKSVAEGVARVTLSETSIEEIWKADPCSVTELSTILTKAILEGLLQHLPLATIEEYLQEERSITPVDTSPKFKQLEKVLHTVVEAVAQNHTEMLTRLAMLDESFDEVLGKFEDISKTVKLIPTGIRRKTQYEGFKFILRSQKDHVTPMTKAVVSADRCIDSRAFEACDNKVEEVGQGVYRINFSAEDMDGSSIIFAFRAVDADPCFHSINPL